MAYRWAGAGLGLICCLLSVVADAQVPARGGASAVRRGGQPGPAAGALRGQAAGNPAAADPAVQQAGADPRDAGLVRAVGGEAPELQPPWYPLPPEHQKYVDDVLQYWEFSSAKIDRYECEFKRWVYDPAVVPPDPKTGAMEAREYSEGILKYMSPDKAMYRTSRVLGYRKARTPEEKSGHQELPIERFGDHWVCDGNSIFEFDHAQKELRQIELPPEARGQAISKGPLPFLFRAKKSEIQERFWIQPVTPENSEGEYWLEAWPKTREDAGHFRCVRIIIDQKEYLPKALIVISRTWTAQNPASETFMFEKRKVNFSLADHLLGPWRRDFYEPATPKGWKKVVQRFEAPAPQPPGQGPEVQGGGTQPVAAPGPRTTQGAPRGAAQRR